MCTETDSILFVMLALVYLRKSNHTLWLQSLLFYTAEQQCVSKAEFDSVVKQMAAQTTAVESELNTWQNATIHILKRFLLDNPGKESVINTGHRW